MKKNMNINVNELERRGISIVYVDTETGMALTTLKSEVEYKKDRYGDCSACSSNDCMGCKYYG